MSSGDVYNESNENRVLFQSSPEWERKIKAGSGFAILIISLLANFIIPFTLLKRNQLLTAGHRFLFSLSSSNLTLTILVIPFIIYSSLIDSWIFGVFWCKFTGFLILSVSIASMLTMGVIAVDRYSAIVKPMVYPTSLTTTKSIHFNFLVWTQAIIFSIPPLFDWPAFQYHHFSSCCLPKWSNNLYYSVSVLILCVLLPFVIMVFCYCKIFQVAHQKCQKIHVGKVSAINDTPSSTNSKKSLWPVIYHSSNKALCIISLVLGTFIFIWFPYVTEVAIEITVGQKTLPSWCQTFASWLCLSGTAIYPLVYGLLNRTIRKEMWSLVWPRRVLIQKPNSKSHRLSISGHIMDFSSPKLFFSRSSLPNTIDYTIFGRRRSSSQDSGAVLTNYDESDLETEASVFASCVSFRRLSAPSCMQNIELQHDIIRPSRFNHLSGSISSQSSEKTVDLETHFGQSITSLEHHRKLQSFFCQRPSLSSISSNKESHSEPSSPVAIHSSPVHLNSVHTPIVDLLTENSSGPPSPMINNLMSEEEKEPQPRQNRLVSVDEGIVDCVLEDVES